MGSDLSPFETMLVNEGRGFYNHPAFQSISFKE
jgi:hypothetical protein